MDSLQNVYEEAISTSEYLSNKESIGTATGVNGELLERYTCDHCGEGASETYYVESTQEDYCEGCNDELVSRCDDCETTSLSSDMQCISGEYICSGCVTDNYQECDECEELHHQDNVVYYSNCEVTICDDCR